MSQQEQYRQLVAHVQSLEPGTQIVINPNPDDNIRSVATRVHEALRDLPNRREFRVSAHPSKHYVLIKRRISNPATFCVTPVPQSSPFSISQPEPSFQGLAQAITDPKKAWKDYLLDLNSQRKLEGEDDAINTLAAIIQSISTDSEISITLTRENTTLWIALALLSIDYHLPPKSSAQIQEEIARLRRQEDPFSFVIDDEEEPIPNSTHSVPSTVSNNETDLEISSDEGVPWWKEED